jgi:predicted Zn-dependent protease
VYGSGSTVYNKTTPSLRKPKAPKPITSESIDQGSSEIVKTKPLKEFVPITTPIEELTPEPLTPEQEQESLAPEQEASLPEQEPATPSPTQEPMISAPKQEPLAPPLPPFEPLETFAPLSPAVSTLALAANQDSKSGNIESATTTIERAIRIEPRNATLYYKLALLRLKQSKPRLAEDLAKKAALLASNDAQLKKHSWLLVARAREMQGDLKGGKEARAKAGKY